MIHESGSMFDLRGVDNSLTSPRDRVSNPPRRVRDVTSDDSSTGEWADGGPMEGCTTRRTFTLTQHMRTRRKIVIASRVGTRKYSCLAIMRTNAFLGSFVLLSTSTRFWTWSPVQRERIQYKPPACIDAGNTFMSFDFSTGN